MSKEISRNKFLEWTWAEEKNLFIGPHGFGVYFDSFDEVAMFFARAGNTAAWNENANTTTNRGFYEDDAFGLAQAATLIKGTNTYLVYFEGWLLI